MYKPDLVVPDERVARAQRRPPAPRRTLPCPELDVGGAERLGAAERRLKRLDDWTPFASPGNLLFGERRRIRTIVLAVSPGWRGVQQNAVRPLPGTGLDPAVVDRKTLRLPAAHADRHELGSQRIAAQIEDPARVVAAGGRRRDDQSHVRKATP